MPEELLKDLDPRLQKQVDNADKAIEKGNPTYAVEICQGVLQRHPGCLEVRKILRRAQKKAVGGKSQGVTRFLQSVTTAPFMLKNASLVKKDPKAALEQAEKLLNANPANVAALRLLGQASEALEFWGTAVFAYESIREVEPQGVDNLVALGNAYIKAGESKEAVRIGDVILRALPGSAEGQDLVRRASVAISMDKGKWEEQGDFRDKLKDAAEAVHLEQASRVMNDAETLARLIGQLQERIEREPDNINLYKEIAGHYRTLREFDSALYYIQQSRQLPLGRDDSTLERLETELKVSSMDKAIQEHEEGLAATPGDPKLTAELEALRKERFAFRLAQAKVMVERYPNDYLYHHEYGALLLDDGQHDLAIREFQVSQRNPKVRLHSLLLLGRAYNAKRFYDLAVDQLNIAKSDSPMMNDLKKEIIYELATAFEKMGQIEKAIEEYKVLYAADIQYRDVAQKINDYYEKKNAVR